MEIPRSSVQCTVCTLKFSFPVSTLVQETVFTLRSDSAVDPGSVRDYQIETNDRFSRKSRNSKSSVFKKKSDFSKLLIFSTRWLRLESELFQIWNSDGTSKKTLNGTSDQVSDIRILFHVSPFLPPNPDCPSERRILWTVLSIFRLRFVF